MPRDLAAYIELRNSRLTGFEALVIMLITSAFARLRAATVVVCLCQAVIGDICLSGAYVISIH